MFASERKIIGVTVPDVEQSLMEQYGRSSLYEQGRSQGSVTYIVRVSSKMPVKAIILPNPNGITLRLDPHISMLVAGLYAVFIVIGLFLFVLPGLLIAFFLVFKTWLAGKLVRGHIDNIVRGAEHQAKLRQQTTPPPMP